MWNVASPNLALLALVASGSVAAAQAPQATQLAELRAAVIAPPAAAADKAGRPALSTSPSAARLDSTHLALPPPQDPGSLAAQGRGPLRPSQRDDVDVDFTFDSADPLDGRFAADRPGLMGLKGRVRF